MVHGDFRMANMKPGEEEKAVLIDFDWARKVGSARYPVTRSDGLDYPGEPRGPIGAGDHRQLCEIGSSNMSKLLYRTTVYHCC